MLDFDSMTPFQLDFRRRLAGGFGGMKIASRDAHTVLRQLRESLNSDDVLMTWSCARGTYVVNPDLTEVPEDSETDPDDRAASLRAFFTSRGDKRTTLVLFDYAFLLGASAGFSSLRTYT